MRVVLALLLLLPHFAFAAASNVFTSAYDTVRLISASNTARNGEVRLALEFSLQPGWHIYWQNPGDAGYPPRITPQPPARFGPLRFPPPARLVQAGLQVNVLSGHVLLPFTATGVGGAVSAQASWLVCAESCVPEHAVFTLNLTGGASAEQALFPPPASAPAHLPYWLLALLGGLVLNLMPCVFPILAMKAFALARLGGAAPGHIRREALGYGAGVLASMLALGGLLLALRAAGQASFWGFQFHAPVFVALAGWIIFAAGLSLAGLFHVSAPGFLRHIPAQHSFLTGLLAVLVATPCTAPFMGTAIAAALTLPDLPALGIFAALGLGLALPVLLLAFIPQLAAWLPRPGAWMLWLQRALALPMFATFVWLAWVLFRQSGGAGLTLLLLGALLLAMALRLKPIAALAVLALLPLLPTAPAAAALSLPNAQPYTAERLAALRAAHQPVFIDLTAAWCVTCLINETTTLATPAVQRAFAAHHVTLLLGDWTSRDPAITALLTAYHRAGVPLYLYYAPGAPVVVLPQLLTPGRVIATLAR